MIAINHALTHLRRAALPLAAAATLVPASAAHAAPAGPRLQAPGAGAAVQSAPLMRWRGLSGYHQYEVQVAADDRFGSLVDRLRTRTANTAMSLETTLADGTYYWRVRGISDADRPTRWSATRSFVKAWTQTVGLQSPDAAGSLLWPTTPLVLSWGPAPYATKYLVSIATDRGLAQPLGGSGGKPIETQGTSLAVPFTLSAGDYFWAVQPVDADGHPGKLSEVRSFTWGWNASTTTRVLDGNDRPEVFDPILDWDAVSGASSYDVQVSSEPGFGPTAVVFQDTVTGTSVAPTKALPNNNIWYWRMRAVDPDGRAGAWQTGPQFRKPFDDPDPAEPGDTTIENLRVTDPATGATLPVGSSLSTPVLRWDPVPGAAAYEVRIVPQMQPGDPSTAYCDWGNAGALTSLKIRTPTPYFDVAPGETTAASPWPATWPSPERLTHNLGSGSYCARVLASDGAGNDSISTQLGSDTQAAFVVTASTRSASCTSIPMAESDDLEPAAGAALTRTPMFRWTDQPGALSYWIVVSRDAAFTDIVDVALVDRPVYVPRRNYGDEDGNLYWAVIASPQANGSCSSATPSTLAARARAFTKLSVPPALSAPAAGVDSALEPVFRWGTAEGAAAYHFQVARDREFRDLIDDETTASTAYAPDTTYPVDTQLFWRVRPLVCQSNCLKLLELRGSDVVDGRSFRRTLPVPALDPANATSGDAIPVFAWTPVPGAVSYDVHIDQADGTKKDFTVPSPRFSPTGWYGTGVWSWKVRANFPSLKSGVKAVSAYSAPMSYTRHIDAPGDAKVEHAAHRLTLSWAPDPAATKYHVQIADSASFTHVVEQVTTTSTNWAPSMTAPAIDAGGRLYWRIQIVDSGNQVGAWRTGSFTLPKQLQVMVLGILRRGRVNQLTVRVSNRGNAVRGARIVVTGRRVRRAVKSDGQGQAIMRLRLRYAGNLRLTVSRRGYVSGTTTAKVLG